MLRVIAGGGQPHPLAVPTVIAQRQKAVKQIQITVQAQVVIAIQIPHPRRQREAGARAVADTGPNRQIPIAELQRSPAGHAHRAATQMIRPGA